MTSRTTINLEGIARTAKGETVTLHAGFAAILKAIKSPSTYEQVERRTGLRVQTLHVYAQRLEEAHLIERHQKKVKGKAKTFVRRADGVLFLGNIRRV